MLSVVYLMCSDYVSESFNLEPPSEGGALSMTPVKIEISKMQVGGSFLRCGHAPHWVARNVTTPTAKLATKLRAGAEKDTEIIVLGQLYVLQPKFKSPQGKLDASYLAIFWPDSVNFHTTRSDPGTDSYNLQRCSTTREIMSDSATRDPVNQGQKKLGTTPHQEKHTAKNLSLGINNTLLRRYMVLSTVKLLRYMKRSEGNVLFLSDKLCVKFGPFVQLSEASTLQFIAEHTSIPVPKVHCAFVHKGCTYILMDRIDGKMLVLDWASRSADSKGKVLQQLKMMIRELRSLPSPGPGISNVDGGPLFDFRFPGTSKAIGPFKSIHEFHLFLRNGLQDGSDAYPEIGRMIALQDRPWPMPVFTHGDLSSLNILVRGDDVVGIIDWETSGWYPSYWEHSMAWYVNPWNVFWREEVGKFLESTPEDMEMEKIRLEHFGDV